jgi:dephospho-CoA kinase
MVPRMIVLGLTGSIAMGKSTAAAMFRRLAVPVFDADAAVHRLLGAGGAAVARIEALFPGTTRGGAVDRPLLAARVFSDGQALARLERLLHPFVYREMDAFIGRARRQRRPLVVVDVPLLYESGGERRCDLVAVVSAPRWVQAARLGARPGYDARRQAAITRRQMPDAEKRRRADVIIPTGLGFGPTRRAIALCIRRLTRRPSRSY